ncbi:ABC transporter substrate-binding protein [Lacrimispora sp.]|uniref:ABC transporter substrate-binding protein n=1 Tax=Lacrimispora sp. TaxID=2719234 RepID=UPI0028A5E61A|nr:extracellular solute-binding protein [Lacrimispora sp.]
MKKRRVMSLLAAALMVCSISACGKQESTSTNASQPEKGQTEESKTEAASQADKEAEGTVKIMSANTGGKDEAEMKLFAEALSQATGLTVEIEKPASDYDKVLMQKLSGGETYDLIYVTASQYSNLVDQGALMDITDRVNGSEILTGNVDPAEWKDITIDGKIYAGFNKKEIHRVVALNNTLLKKAGIDYKKIEPTMDGYYDVMKKLKDNSQDPDFYPFDAILSETYDLQPWMAAEGLKNGVVLDTSGKRFAPYAEEEAAPVWEWFKKLYDEGLLDPASFVDKTKDMRAKMGASSQKTAVTADWTAWVGLHNANAKAGGISPEDYEVVSLPGLKTPDGSYMLVKGSASLFAVPANAKNPDGAMKVLEYFATQEGGNLLSTGISGHDYTGTEGKFELTETGAQHANDHGAPFPINKDFKPIFGFNPGVEEALSYSNYATIDMIIPNEKDYKEIVGKWGIKIIKGEVSSSDGLSGMRKELVDRKVTDR